MIFKLFNNVAPTAGVMEYPMRCKKAMNGKYVSIRKEGECSIIKVLSLPAVKYSGSLGDILKYQNCGESV
jgi:hypothetical protein